MTNDDSFPLIVGGENLRQAANRPGRGDFEPYFPYDFSESVDRLTPQIESLTSDIGGLDEAVVGEFPIIEATLLPQFLAASRFPKDLFKSAGLVPVGTRNATADELKANGNLIADQPTRSVFLAVTDGVDRLERIVQTPSNEVHKDIAAGVRAIDRLVLAHPTVDAPSPKALGDDELELWESVLHGTYSRGQTGPASSTTVARWSSLLESLGGVVESDWIREEGSLTYVPVRLNRDSIERAQRFNPLRAIHAFPRLQSVPDGRPAAGPFALPSEEPSPERDDSEADAIPPLRVAVFDGGIDDQSKAWAGRARNIIVGSLKNDQLAGRHGSLVTSAMLYGHLDGASLPEPANIDIHHYASLPQVGYDEDLEMYWLLDLIEGVVSNDTFDVVAICVAPQMLVADDNVNRWTSTLDRLAYEHDVLFVVAVGNNGEANATFGANRIMVPADASNAIAVGAGDQPPGSSTRSKRAPYSAVGPGRVSAQGRPSGIAFGGVQDNEFFATDNDGTRLAYTGTSCAAPLVVNGLADLVNRLGPDPELRTPTALRAMAMHFVDRCANGQKPHEVGHGLFQVQYPMVNEGAANEAHVLYQGTIGRKEFIPLNIPVPDGLNPPLSIRYTLATSTAVAPHDPVDYTMAGLDVTFRPNADHFNMIKKGQPPVTVRRHDSSKIQQMLREGYRESEPLSASIETRPRHEGRLRGDGKWESVRVGKHKYTLAGKVHRPRIDISHIARDGGILVDRAPDLDWTMVVSISADAAVNLHAQVLQSYPVLSTLQVSAATVTTQSA